MLFDDACFLEGGVCAELVDGLEAVGRYIEYECFLEFRHKNALLLKVWILADHAGRIELRSTGTV